MGHVDVVEQRVAHVHGQVEERSRDLVEVDGLRSQGSRRGHTEVTPPARRDAVSRAKQAVNLLR